MIEVVLVYRRDDEGLDSLRTILKELTEELEEFSFIAEYNVGSSKFLEKRTANSLMSQHGTVNTPLILFKKEGIIARAVYKEEVEGGKDYKLLIVEKYLDTIKADIEALRPLEEEDFGIDI